MRVRVLALSLLALAAAACCRLTAPREQSPYVEAAGGTVGPTPTGNPDSVVTRARALAP
jgi:hypothetical protein